MKRLIVYQARQFAKPSFPRYLLNVLLEKPSNLILMYYVLGSYFPSEFLKGATEAIPTITHKSYDSRFTPSLKKILPFNFRFSTLKDVYIHNFRINYGSPTEFQNENKYNIVYNPVDFSMMTYPKTDGKPSNFREFIKDKQVQIVVDVGVVADLSYNESTIRNTPTIVSFCTPFLKPGDTNTIPSWQVCDLQYILLKRQINDINGVEYDEDDDYDYVDDEVEE